MKRWMLGVLGVGLIVGPLVWAEEGHDYGGHEHGTSSMQQSSGTGATGEQTLTGEVVDVFCYLSHNKEGLGASHAKCAKHCIDNGLPVAIKVGKQLYLASMADHVPANTALAAYAGKQVTVHGKIMERDGQHLVAISKIDEAH